MCCFFTENRHRYSWFTSNTPGHLNPSPFMVRENFNEITWKLNVVCNRREYQYTQHPNLRQEFRSTNAHRRENNGQPKSWSTSTSRTFCKSVAVQSESTLPRQVGWRSGTDNPPAHLYLSNCFQTMGMAVTKPPAMMAIKRLRCRCRRSRLCDCGAAIRRTKQNRRCGTHRFEGDFVANFFQTIKLALHGSTGVKKVNRKLPFHCDSVCLLYIHSPMRVFISFVTGSGNL